jgi:DNA-binding NarL/FixJ family response regulator
MSALVAALGHVRVRKLTAIAGGRALFIPRMTADPSSQAARARLVGLVGVDIATDLITTFAGTRVYIPAGPTTHNSRANPIDARKVDRLTKRGKSAAEIATALGCTVRTVHKKRAALALRRKS